MLESKYGSPKIVNDGVTVAKEVELSDPVENIGAKLVRQASSKTNDLAGAFFSDRLDPAGVDRLTHPARVARLAGDGTTTATILSAALISEGLKVVAAGSNPIQIVRGIEKTVQALVKHLKTNISMDIRSDEDLMNIAAVSAGNSKDIGKLISDAMAKVGRSGVVTMQESRVRQRPRPRG